MSRSVAHKGEQRQIVFAVTAAGSPAMEFIAGLDGRDRARVFKLFERLGDHGRISNDQQFKSLVETDFYEFKPTKQIRLMCYQAGLLWIVTHGFVKKRDKIDPEEIRRADRIKAEDTALAKSRVRLLKAAPARWK